MKLDILAFGAHPDDVEFSAGGTLCKAIAEGKKVGIIDLTRGELGTRGTAEIRDQEAKDAAQIMGLSVRENLGFRDCFFQNDETHQLEIIKKIRAYRPDIVLTNSNDKRHPDHARGKELVQHAAFLSGLIKIDTGQDAWRATHIFEYIQARDLKADFVIGIDTFYDQKIKAMKAYKSQFRNPNYETDEPETVLTSPEFWSFVECRAKNYGRLIGTIYGEGFVSVYPPKINQLTDLL